MFFFFRKFFILLALVGTITPCLAISENNYAQTYSNAVIPFLNSGQRFNFPSADGKYALSGIRFLHPHAKGMIEARQVCRKRITTKTTRTIASIRVWMTFSIELRTKMVGS